MSPIQLPILHWNDVYRVRPQKLPGSKETIDCTQFAALLDDIRDQWAERRDGKREGLVLFSGDVFSPSVESSVTRGSHMVPVMNKLAPDASLLGNHDFDFGYPHLCKLMADTQFPWLLSNVIDKTKNTVPEHVDEFQVLERQGVRIGIIGLIEKEWIGTISSWPSEFEYCDAAQVGIALSKKLRDPNGEHKCDLVIALTHARVPNDVALAKSLFALTPKAQKTRPISNEHGVDLILGGHDHLYFVGRGVDAWENYDLTDKPLGAEKDEGDVMVIKSGTDFRDLSEFTIELEDAPEGSVRRKVISRISGKHHEIAPHMRKCDDLQKTLDGLLQSVGSALKAPLCRLEVQLDVRSQLIRTQEMASSNWFADILRHTYDDALVMKGVKNGADGVFICAGMLRGDSTYGPGYLTLGDVLEVLPFEDPLVVVEIDGWTLWETLEASLSTWPAQEGRFPVISGFRITWDSRRPPGQRVLGVWMQEEDASGSDSGTATPVRIDGAAVERTKGGRMYYIVTRQYMVEGHDGFEPLIGSKEIIDDEAGQITSTVVRKYLLGAQFVNKLAATNESREHLDEETHALINRARHARQRESLHRHSARVLEKWKRAASQVAHRLRSTRHYRDHIHITGKEHMSDVDCFDGSAARKAGLDGGEDGEKKVRGGEGRDKSVDAVMKKSLLVVHPVVDGRLKDEARPELSRGLSK